MHDELEKKIEKFIDEEMRYFEKFLECKGARNQPLDRRIAIESSFVSSFPTKYVTVEGVKTHTQPHAHTHKPTHTHT